MSGVGLSPPVRHPDRSGLPRPLWWALHAAVGVACALAGQAAAQGRVSSSAGALIGFGLALFAMVGLPSLSLRVVSRVLLGLSAALLVRFGVFSTGESASGLTVVVWLVAAVAVLVVSDRAAAVADPALGTDPAPMGAAGPRTDLRTAGLVRSVAVVAAVVVALALVLGPLIPFDAPPTEAGEGASLDALSGQGSALRATNSLDMTRRPELTDDIVFTVETDRATFWRGQTFDRWDGRTWTRSDDSFRPLLAGDQLRIAEHDLGAAGDDVVRQRIRMAASYADVVYAAPSAVELTIDRPVRQRADGTLVSVPMGPGTAYTVESRREVLSEQRLRGLDRADIPAAVLAQYAQPPQATQRVLDVATEITEGIESDYDKVLALQAWMGDRVEYSLDAPLAPQDQDVVDHFLFEAEQGWCEQVASSLVVLARANGIPARLVTGFVPGDRDPVTGVFTVRAREAHAWTEVWFPEVGWVSFDPTADVPLAGDDAPAATLGQWLLAHIVQVAVGIAVLVLLAGPVRRLVARRLARRRAPAPGWVARVETRLDRLGARVDRPRAAHETATVYAAALAHRYGLPQLAEAGLAVDDETYARSEPDPTRRVRIDASLDDLLAAPAPETEPELTAPGRPSP